MSTQTSQVAHQGFVFRSDAVSDDGVVRQEVSAKEPSSEHEYLAKNIAYPTDRPIAAKFSILNVPNLREKMEKGSWVYLFLWPLIMLISATFALRVMWYNWRVRPTDKTRKLLGPERMSYLFDKAHPLGQQLRDGVTTSAALDGYYNAPLLLPNPKTLGERVLTFSLNSPEPCAVRNRLRITYREILAELQRLYDGGQRKVDYLSLACGSAQATVEAVSFFLREHPDMEINLLLVDLNQDSLKQASYFARKRNIDHCMKVRFMDLKRFLKKEAAGKWDIVEMVGFLDYRPVKSVAGYAEDIRRILRRGGLFIGAHIAPSPWSFMVRWWLNWPLLQRRSPELYRCLLQRGGFLPHEITMEVEPNKIHAVSMCRRS